MARGKKFGAFGGVFTPSVLTILGVIMYLRLGWVVGSAGWIGTIIIVLISHVISVTTGLSVSSVATDRKVKAGGLYYMLSRSLGLPIGGSIGITLFVGTALSISMYIVGFSESFNGAIGYTDPNGLRITGTITLVLITTIALISTSFAIKTQYYIMAAIALSLVSIICGIAFFPVEEITATSVQNFRAEGDETDLAIIFGIFFPAVTGFTAGVAMSGDLKDPKKAIPVGTIASIAVGLIVYIGLTLLISFSIDSQALREDDNILTRVTFLVTSGWLPEGWNLPYLLYAGIWGATLSSALGGILGGPRILQAMSWDKITPKLFGQGVGASNEPRNALILTFVLAEAGVLIGDLNAIAPIVSMFYLSAYGFINLTSALESWTGSDFRPSFKIPWYVSVLGAVATFLVMAQINVLAMIGSFLIIGALFFYLTKKQINLGFTDIWQGVWAELVRIGLFRIDKKLRAKKKDKKNWRPNILLFSGDTGRRPYLVDFGKSVVGRLGVVSSFELIEAENLDQPLTRSEQVVDTGSGFTGMFFRKYQCRNIYEGIRTITETYGFSGIEPNTVMMGWARYSKSPVDFAKLIGRFHKMDYNMLVMDYDQRVGFGDNTTIDIWWNGTGGNATFALTMARFLTADDAWIKAKVRLFIMLDKSLVNSTEVYQIMEDELEELRIYADVKIVDNQRNTKDLYDAIEIESNRADLIFVELPQLEEGFEDDFFTETDKLCKEIGTVVLYRSASNFEEIDIGLNLGVRQLEAELETEDLTEEALTIQQGTRELILPQKEAIGTQFQRMYEDMVKAVQHYDANYLQPIAREHALLAESIRDLLKLSLAKIQLTEEDQAEELDWDEVPRQAFQDAESLLKNFSTNKLNAQSKALYKGIQEVNRRMSKVVRSFPRSIPVTFHLEELEANGKEETLKKFNPWQRFRAKNFKKPIRYRYKFRAFVLRWLRQFGLETARDLARNFNDDAVSFNEEFQQVLRRFGAIMQQLIDNKSHNSVELVNILEEADRVNTLIDTVIQRDQVRFERYTAFILESIHRNLQNAITDIDSLNFKPAATKRFGFVDTLQEVRNEILDTPQVWAANQSLFTNIFGLDLMLQEFQSKLKLVVLDLKQEFRESLNESVLFDLKKMMVNFSNYLEEETSEEDLPKNGRDYSRQVFQYRQAMLDFLGDLEWLMGNMPAEIEVLSEHAIQHPRTGEVIDLESITIAPNMVINYTVQNYFTEQVIAEMGTLDAKVLEANEVMQDIDRVLSVSLKNLTGDDNKEELKELIKSELERLEIVYESLVNYEDSIIKLINTHISNVTERLTTYGLVKEAVNLDSSLLMKTRERVFSIFTRYWNKSVASLYETLTELRYQKSESLAKSTILLDEKYQENVTDQVLSLVETVSPKQEILDTLPFYYKQLFLKEQSSSLELWHDREKALAAAKIAIQRHKQGLSGAILVTGEPDSGKSFLSEKIAQEYFKEDQVIIVQPPENQTADLKTFRSVMNRAFGKKTNYRLDTLFNRMEEGTVIVFHDLELWWERSEKGSEVLERLTTLIDQFSTKCLFVLNMNRYTKRFFQHLGILEGSYLQVIECEPFTAKDIKDVILLRHRSSHLKFRLEGVIESELSDWKLAGLFTKHFRYSQGNIGISLQAWLGHIVGATKTELEITFPKTPNTEILDSLPADWMIVLFQFLLHKKMSADKLIRVMGSAKEVTEHLLQTLLRTGLLTEVSGMIEINRYLSPHLLASFEKKGLI